MKRATILVVDDEDIVCQSCSLLLSEQGHEVRTTLDSQQGLEMAREHPFELILVDLKMPGLDGMAFLRAIKDVQPDTEVIVMTGFAEITSAVAAIKLGAFDYIPKPFSPDELLVAAEKALQARDMRDENRYLRRELQSRYRLDTIVGTSPSMRKVYDVIDHVCTSNVTVLIRGESGTGKELVARAIHFNSPRKGKRFVAVDCGALHENLLESELFGHVKGAFTGAIANKKGLFETAEGGSLFLDEVGNTSLPLQTKLLRVLQERVYTPVGDSREHKADVRLIAATNRDLEAMVAEGTFRQELFYRLSIVPITLPPLRERGEDIPTLAAHFLQKFARDHGRPTPTLSPEAQHCLLQYPWPGNVRELENVMQRICVLSAASVITPAELPPEFLPSRGVDGEVVPRTSDELKERKRLAREKSIEDVERSFVLAALERTNWNVSRAAQDVQMQRSNFQALMRRHGIVKPQ